MPLTADPDVPVPVAGLDVVLDDAPPLSVERPIESVPTMPVPVVPSERPSDALVVTRVGIEPWTTPVLWLLSELLPIDGGGATTSAPIVPRPSNVDGSLPIVSIVSGTVPPTTGGTTGVPVDGVSPDGVPPVPVPGNVGTDGVATPPEPGATPGTTGLIVGAVTPTRAPARIPGAPARTPTDGEPDRIRAAPPIPDLIVAPAEGPLRVDADDVLDVELPVCASAGTAANMKATLAALMVLNANMREPP